MGPGVEVGHHRAGALGRVSRAWRTVAVVIAAVALVVAAFAVLAALVDRPFGYLSKEPSETLQAPAYVGWFAHLVALVWAVAATVALAAGAALRAGGRPERSRLFLAAGALSTALVLDDLFLLHEALYPRLGLAEDAVYVAYAVLGLAFLAVHRAHLRDRDLVPFVVVAGAFLGLSVLIDLAGTGGRHVIEDGAKAIGATLWATGLARAAHVELVALITPAAPRPSDIGRPVRPVDEVATRV